MSAPDRAALIAAWRVALDIAEADPSLPLPDLAPYNRRVEFWLYGNDVARQFAAVEAAFTAAGAGPFTDGIDAEKDDQWLSTGNLGGVPVLIRAPAAKVAERTVVGMVEKVDWRRRPVEDEGPGNGAGEAARDE